MDNQQNQPGPMPGDDIRVQNAGTNTGSTGLGNDATVSGAASTSRKGGARGGAQAASSDSDAQPTAQADQSGSEGQQEGQNDQLGNKLLDSVINSGKKWVEDSGVLNSVNQLPENVKSWGSRAVSRVNDLSTTQKVIGGTLLAAGIGWLALRKGKSSSDSSESSPYNYGRQRDAGSYGRRSYGYQAPDASGSRNSASGANSRSDSGAAYGNSGSRYGGSGSSYSSGSSYNSGASNRSGNTGINSGSGRSSYGSSASANTDHGSRTSESSHTSGDDNFRSVE